MSTSSTPSSLIISMILIKQRQSGKGSNQKYSFKIYFRNSVSYKNTNEWASLTFFKDFFQENYLNEIQMRGPGWAGWNDVLKDFFQKHHCNAVPGIEKVRTGLKVIKYWFWRKKQPKLQSPGFDTVEKLLVFILVNYIPTGSSLRQFDEAYWGPLEAIFRFVRSSNSKYLFVV